MKNKFTLIELIVVIAVVGILAAMVIPNISSMKEKSIKAAIVSNIRNLQTAVDLYKLDHNENLPTETPPTLYEPQPIDFDILYPDYTKNLPSLDMDQYWVDAYGEVWGSTVDAPSGIDYVGNDVQWKQVEKSYGYQIYSVNEDRNKSILAAINKVASKLQVGQFNLDLSKNDYKNRTFSYPTDGKSGYVVSSVDKYGLPTAPVGKGYEGYILDIKKKPQSGVFKPITDLGTYFIITNANGLAYWDGVQKSEEKPVGTNILYTFYTSMDGKNYQEVIGATPNNIKELAPRANYMKVKIELTGDATKNIHPTLYKFKILFHLENEDSFEIIPAPENAKNIILNPDGSVELKPGETEGGFSQNIKLPSKQSISKIDMDNVTPPGTEVTHNYQSSNDGGETFSEPTPFPDDLPPGDTIKQNTTLKRNNPNIPTPTVKGGTVTTTTPKQPLPVLTPDALKNEIPLTEDPKSPTPNEEGEEEYETISTFSLEFDATEVGDWINAIIEDSQPAGTKITYEYSTSNDEINWSGKTENINEVANSRFLNVDIIKKRLIGSTSMPEFYSINMNYKLNDGTLKESKKIGDLTSMVQNALDKYKLAHGVYPTMGVPTEQGSTIVDFTKLVPSYLTVSPAMNGINYSVDFLGNLWISTISAPSDPVSSGNTIAWTTVKDAKSYNVFKLERQSTSGAAIIGSTNGMSFVQNTTIPSFVGQEGQEYMITSIDSQGNNSAPSKVVKIANRPAPKTLGVTVSRTTDSITLSLKVDNADTIEIYRDGTKIATLSGTTTSYKDAGLLSGTKYNYLVRASNTGGNIESTINTETLAVPPTVGTITGSAGNNSVTISFASIKNAKTIEVYKNGSLMSSYSGSLLNWSGSGMSYPNGVPINFYIIAINDAGSTKSNTITLTPKAN